MGNRTEELIAKIKQAKANRVEAFRKAKEEEQRMYDNYQAEFNKLGERIKQIRLSKGISQEKFALSIEMDRTYYASVESGKRNISIINIEKISNGLEISLEELFEGI